MVVARRNQLFPAPAPRVQSKGSWWGRTPSEEVQGDSGPPERGGAAMEEGNLLLGTGQGVNVYRKCRSAPDGAPKALENLLLWSHLQEKQCGHARGGKQEGFVDLGKGGL